MASPSLDGDVIVAAVHTPYSEAHLREAPSDDPWSTMLDGDGGDAHLITSISSRISMRDALADAEPSPAAGVAAGERPFQVRTEPPKPHFVNASGRAIDLIAPRASVADDDPPSVEPSVQASTPAERARAHAIDAPYAPPAHAGALVGARARGTPVAEPSQGARALYALLGGLAVCSVVMLALGGPTAPQR